MKPPVDLNVESAGRGMQPSKAGEAMKESWPGEIKFANERGHFFGCKIEVMGAEEVNSWAHTHPNHVIVEIAPAGLLGKVAVIWTKVLSDEEMEEMGAIQREAEEIHRKKKEERAKLQTEADAKAQEEQKARAAKAEAELDEMQRLAALARKMAKRDELVKITKRAVELLSEYRDTLPEDSLLRGHITKFLTLETIDAAPGK